MRACKCQFTPQSATRNNLVLNLLCDVRAGKILSVNQNEQNQKSTPPPSDGDHHIQSSARAYTKMFCLKHRQQDWHGDAPSCNKLILEQSQRDSRGCKTLLLGVREDGGPVHQRKDRLNRKLKRVCLALFHCLRPIADS